VSLDGLLATRGACVRIRRATRGANTVGATTRTWDDAPDSPVRMLLEELTAGKAQRAWGLETLATFRATVSADADVQKLDGCYVEDGRFAGTFLRVEEDPRGSELGPQFRVLGLVRTPTERFGL
jgi:hypothetical protein